MLFRTNVKEVEHKEVEQERRSNCKQCGVLGLSGEGLFECLEGLMDAL